MAIFVMAGLDPAIHVFLAVTIFKTWITGTSPVMTMTSYALPTKLSTTFFSPALSKSMVSLLPSIFVTLP